MHDTRRTPNWTLEFTIHLWESMSVACVRAGMRSMASTPHLSYLPHSRVIGHRSECGVEVWISYLSLSHCPLHAVRTCCTVAAVVTMGIHYNACIHYYKACPPTPYRTDVRLRGGEHVVSWPIHCASIRSDSNRDSRRLALAVGC